MFNPSEKEVKAVNDWVDAHCQDRSCPFYDDGGPISPVGAIGGKFSYCFTPTGIGTGLVVSCVCGARLDATDYDSW